jgi:hypothetical protein
MRVFFQHLQYLPGRPRLNPESVVINYFYSKTGLEKVLSTSEYRSIIEPIDEGSKG